MQINWNVNTRTYTGSHDEIAKESEHEERVLWFASLENTKPNLEPETIQFIIYLFKHETCFGFWFATMFRNEMFGDLLRFLFIFRRQAVQRICQCP